MTRLSQTCLALCLLLALDAVSAPIRVGIFTGTAEGRYWHTNSHTASTAIAGMLANPSAAGLGGDLTSFPMEFSTVRLGRTSTCTQTCNTPTDAQKAAFLDALDTLDVMVFASNVDIGNIFPSATHRTRLLAFLRSRGVVSLHHTTMSYQTWPAWDSLHGAIFENHPSSDRQAKVRLDSMQGNRADATWWALNAGLNDTTFLEEWLSFTTNGNIIRAVPGLKVLLNVDESTYMGGLFGARAMGDHPISWYRELPEGGRFFYTAVGHRANLYQGGTQPRFLRRQIYNAILWAGGSNEEGTSIHQGKPGTDVSGGLFGEYARVNLSGGTLTVSLLRDGAHTVEILALNGRRVDARHGSGRSDYALEGLRSGAHVLRVTTPSGRFVKRVVIP